MTDWLMNVHPVGLLYARSTLDCVIEVACAVAEDFVKRPGDYTDVSDETKRLLSAFQRRTGKSSEWPDLVERTQTYGAFVDPFLAKDPANVCASEIALRRAAATLVEADSGRNDRVLQSAFADAVIAFQRHLRGLEHLTQNDSARSAALMFDRAISVLRSPHVAAAFDQKAPSVESWPYDPDEAGSALVVAISAELVPQSAHQITIHEFDIVQRLARLRAETLSAVMVAYGRVEPDSTWFQSAVDLAYRWEKVVAQCLWARAIRAWRNVDYRALLSGEEISRLPASPAGGLIIGDGGPASLNLAFSAAECQ